MAELQQLRRQLLELAFQASDSDAGRAVGSRAIQVALMEILDSVDENDEEEANQQAAAAGSNDTTPEDSGAGR